MIPIVAMIFLPILASLTSRMTRANEQHDDADLHRVIKSNCRDGVNLVLQTAPCEKRAGDRNQANDEDDESTVMTLPDGLSAGRRLRPSLVAADTMRIGLCME